VSLTPKAARVLAGQLRAEVDRVSREAEALEQIGRSTEGAPDATTIWAAAGHLQAFYTGIQAAMLRVLKEIDGVVPSGPDSHQEIMRQASIEIPEVRPAFIDPPLGEALGPYRAFRHFFRHAYGVTLRWEKLEAKVRSARAVLGQVAAAVGRFHRFLDTLANG
jgi:hypothetical protein